MGSFCINHQGPQQLTLSETAASTCFVSRIVRLTFNN